MCGIAGIWGMAEEEASIRLSIMLRAMHHRGPDGQGQTTWESGAAGMVRLALLDLSKDGQQPIWSPNHDVAILFNGEMVNWKEHRKSLEADGYPFVSHTDTEVVLALYLKYGKNCFSMLRGMYAVALLDFRGRHRQAAPRLILARDPFGIKPLYVVEKADCVAFSSELRALVESSLLRPRVDPIAIQQYVSCGFVVQPRSIFVGARMVLPGVVEEFDLPEKHTTERFYS